jgi:hypothetical protein
MQLKLLLQRKTKNLFFLNYHLNLNLIIILFLFLYKK